MPADYCLWRNLPGKPNPRRNAIFSMELRVVVPTHSEIQGKVVTEFPVVLRKHPVVIISQMDLIGLWRETANRGNRKEAGVGRSVLHEVVYSGKELHVLYLRLDTVDDGAQKAPAKLYIVVAKQPPGVS